MLLSLSSYAVVAALAGVSSAASYFVAGNCETKYPGISESFKEAWSMAAHVANTMDADNDDNQKLVYSNLFKDRDTVANKQTIRDYFALLGSLQLVSDAKQADLIYDCDNDSNDRWKQLDGRKVYNDEVYYMRTEKEEPGCRRLNQAGEPRALANTYRNPLEGSEESKQFKAGRTVVSICDKLLRSYPNWGTASKLAMSLLSKQMLDPQGGMKDVLSILGSPCTSPIILHEAFHSRLIGPDAETHKIDVKGTGNPGPAYGWAKARVLSRDDQFKNADNFAVYAFALEVFKRGYTIGDGENDLATGTLKKVAEAAKEVARMIRSLPSKCRNWVYRRANDC
ncbi:hypothetical protein NLU13_2664 [Sarocladium strictum]|uniref:Uncharacterized protein n=1 Tax=Sarocladium strictum TaxID=5046 RepID=A0AA39L9J8_SARSR|nr:hypothetical protein NLU13_2664 [Sarocladium strictum]